MLAPPGEHHEGYSIFLSSIFTWWHMIHRGGSREEGQELGYRWASRRHVCCQQRHPSNVKSITAHAELFDNISQDRADTRFSGVYIVFSGTCQKICWSAVYMMPLCWPGSRVATAEISSSLGNTVRAEQSCLGLKGNTYGEIKSHLARITHNIQGSG